MTLPIRIAIVENRHDIDSEASAGKRHGHGEWIRFDLFTPQIRNCRKDLFRKPIDKITHIRRCFTLGDIDCNIGVVEGFECCTLSEATGQQHLFESKVWVFSDMVLESLSEPVDLVPVLLGIVPLEVDPFISEADDVRM